MACFQQTLFTEQDRYIFRHKIVISFEINLVIEGSKRKNLIKMNLKNDECVFVIL